MIAKMSATAQNGGFDSGACPTRWRYVLQNDVGGLISRNFSARRRASGKSFRQAEVESWVGHAPESKPPFCAVADILAIMTRGNQRDKAREKNLKDQAQAKKKNTLSGTEFQRTKEAQAAIMRQKQEAAEAKKAAEGASGAKKK